MSGNLSADAANSFLNCSGLTPFQFLSDLRPVDSLVQNFIGPGSPLNRLPATERLLIIQYFVAIRPPDAGPTPLSVSGAQGRESTDKSQRENLAHPRSEEHTS